jgi:arabinofuranan 3-O-arabinosyltransferase
MDSGALAQALERRGALLVTDTNRRRVEVIGVAGEESATLHEDGVLDRPPALLWETPGANAVAIYGAASSITATGAVSLTSGVQPWHRPALAADGDPETTWLVGGLLDPIGERLRIELAARTRVLRISVERAPPAAAGGRQLSGATVWFSDGTHHSLRFRSDVAVLAADHETSWIEMEITAVEGTGSGPVGIAELTVDHLDLRERIRLPDDVYRHAAADPDLAAALADAPVAYGFQRAIGTGPEDEELHVRRRFFVDRQRALSGAGTASLRRTVPEQVTTDVAPGVIDATASSRLNDDVSYAGIRAVDGRRSTAWLTDDSEGAWLDLQFPEQRVESVVVHLRTGRGLRSPSALSVRRSDGTVAGRATVTATCPGGRQCQATVEIPVHLPATTQIRLQIDETDDGTNRGRAVRVDEVEINGAPNREFGTGAGECLPGLIQVDGVDLGVRLADWTAALRGESLSFTTCGTITLDAGWHDLDAATGLLLDSLLLTPPGWLVGTADQPAGSLVVQERQPTALRMAVSAPTGARVVVIQSWHPAWRAALDGRDLGPPEEVDGFLAWSLPPGSSGTVEVRFSWQRWYELALLLGAVGVIACAVALRTRPAEAT